MSGDRLVGSACLALVLFAVGCGPAGERGPAGAPGPSALVKLTPEAEGANCERGGTRVQTGTDLDSNGVLDDTEIDAAQTRFVCNGAQGEPGTVYAPGPGLSLSGATLSVVFGDSAGTALEGNTTRFIRNSSPSATGQRLEVEHDGEPNAALKITANSEWSPGCPKHVPGIEVGNGTPYVRRGALGADGSLVVESQLGCGDIPATGEGYRLMWHPFKAGFRAGYTGAEGAWDDANIGFFSWAGGASNKASGYASFAMGANAVASGTNSVAIGHKAIANGKHAIALGTLASAGGKSGTFVWSDASSTEPLEATADNQFSIRAAGGVRLFTNASRGTGVTLNAGGSSWNVVSDREAKTGFQPVDGDEVLRKIAGLPLTSWTYKDEAGQPRHVGPMAQDFHAAFGLGSDDRTINSLDLDGVSLIAAQALERRTRELEERTRQVKQMENELGAMRREMATMQRQLEEQHKLLQRLVSD